MPLLKCPTCQKEVSDKAPACPNCGEPMKSSVEKAAGGAVNMGDPVHFIGIILVGFMVLGIIVFVMQGLN